MSNRPPVERVPELPRSAWLYHRGPSQERILAGTGVEEFPSGIFEGCWSGEFSRADFVDAENVFGTGISFTGSAPRFVTHSYVTNELFAWVDDRGETVSNSLSLLLEFCEISLPYADWGRRFFAVAHGIDANYHEIYRSDEGRLLRVVHDNFEITNGNLKYFRLSPGPAFENYADYRRYLGEQVGLAMRNGRHPSRRRRLRMVAAVSGGYDSVAAMAVAAEHGLDAVLTLVKSREGLDDSAGPAAADLGLPVVERIYTEGSAGLETEVKFFATGCGGEDLNLSAFADQLEDAVLINGFGGDAIWDPGHAPDTVLSKPDRAGTSTGEFFLDLGAVLMTVPGIGARRHPEIREIGLSAEMAPWRIGGNYDRPVPRRIAEDAGVQRTSFARHKGATTQIMFFNASRFSKFVSQGSFEDFKSSERDIVGGNWLRYRTDLLRHVLPRKANRALSLLLDQLPGGTRVRRRITPLLLGGVEEFKRAHPRLSSVLFLWALNHRRQVYRRAIKSAKRPERLAEN